MNIIKSPINYTGTKQRLLPQLIPLFPKEVSRFVDVFTGGASVVTSLCKNNYAREYVANDLNAHVIELYNYLQKVDIDYFIDNIYSIIKKYSLSDSEKYGYSFYGTDSGKGLAEFNRKQYILLRDQYNRCPNIELFYTLIVYSFNNQIRFNSYGKFNSPVGKRDFNRNLKNKLVRFSEVISDSNIKFICRDFTSLELSKGDFAYFDPPYLISSATYNEQKKWTIDDEKRLYDFMNMLDKEGVFFALSNVTSHNSMTNSILIDWMKQFNVHSISSSYSNSNYQKKLAKISTEEVLITNY